MFVLKIKHRSAVVYSAIFLLLAIVPGGIAKSSPDTLAQEKLPPVINPEQFYGSAALGYAAAKGAPQTMKKIFCYCGCDITDEHTSLLDCFTSLHGVECHICQEESMLAYKLHRDDTPVAQIQKQVDELFAAKYPFKEPSLALKHYRSSRLYKPDEASLAQEKNAHPTAQDNQNVGSCCKKK